MTLAINIQRIIRKLRIGIHYFIRYKRIPKSIELKEHDMVRINGRLLGYGKRYLLFEGIVEQYESPTYHYMIFRLEKTTQ